MKSLYLTFFISILIISCKSTDRSDGSSSSGDEAQPEKTQAVCIMKGVPLREEPKKDGKWISSIELGETMTYLGETVKDSSERIRTFLKVELSDGSQAWARSYGILTDSRPAAVVKNAPVYKRPDLVTKTDKDFFVAEFVAITDEKDDWIKVTGSGKRKSGWIQKSAVTENPEDIAVATLASNKVIDKQGNIKTENLSEFLEEIPYREATLTKYFQSKLQEEVELAIEKSIMEYEEGNEADE